MTFKERLFKCRGVLADEIIAELLAWHEEEINQEIDKYKQRVLKIFEEKQNDRENN